MPNSIFCTFYFKPNFVRAFFQHCVVWDPVHFRNWRHILWRVNLHLFCSHLVWRVHSAFQSRDNEYYVVFVVLLLKGGLNHEIFYFSTPKESVLCVMGINWGCIPRYSPALTTLWYTNTVETHSCGTLWQQLNASNAVATQRQLIDCHTLATRYLGRKNGNSSPEAAQPIHCYPDTTSSLLSRYYKLTAIHKQPTHCYPHTTNSLQSTYYQLIAIHILPTHCNPYTTKSLLSTDVLQTHCYPHTMVRTHCLLFGLPIGVKIGILSIGGF